MLAPEPKQLRCYVASPLGFDEGGRTYYSKVLLPAIARVVVPIDPWSLTNPVEVNVAEREGTLPELRLLIGRRNTEALRRADLLVAYLEGQEVDSGTAAEIGFASASGIPCFGLRSDMRRCGDLGATVNLQVESFILESGGLISETLDELVSQLRAFWIGRGGS